MVELGDRYFMGNGVPKNYSEAARYYKMAAKLNNHEGMHKYGVMLEQGFGIPVNKRKAAKYFQLSADLGNVKSMYKIAQIYQNGDGIECNNKKAEYYYNKASSQHDAELISKFGAKFLNDPINPYFYFKMAANIGGDEEKVIYANKLCCDAIYGNFDKNTKVLMFEEALPYLKKAAEMGNIDAMENYSMLFYYKYLQYDDLENVIKFSRIAAQHKKENAMFIYSTYLLKKDMHDIKNLLEAYRYLTMLAKKGNQKAFFLAKAIFILINQNNFKIKPTNIDKNFYEGFGSDLNNKTNISNSNCDKTNKRQINDICYQKNCNKNDNNQNNNNQNNNNQNNNNQNSNNQNNNNQNNNNQNSNNQNNNNQNNNNQNNNNQNNNNQKVNNQNKNNQNVKKKKNNNNSNHIDNKTKPNFDDTRKVILFNDKSINDININFYKPLIPESNNFICLSQSMIPKEIQKDITKYLNNFLSIIETKKDVFYQNDTHYLYTFYFISNCFFLNIIKNSLMQIMENHEIKFYQPRFDIDIFFDERIFPEQELEIFLKQVKNIQGIIDIKRNVFDGNKISTYLIIENGQQKNIYKSIKNLLVPKQLLFNSAQYPLKNNIIINEKIVLQNENDFDIIVNEIKSIIKPINIERNKLLIYNCNQTKNFLENFLLFILKMKY